MRQLAETLRQLLTERRHRVASRRRFRYRRRRRFRCRGAVERAQALRVARQVVDAQRHLSFEGRTLAEGAEAAAAALTLQHAGGGVGALDCEGVDGRGAAGGHVHRSFQPEKLRK